MHRRVVAASGTSRYWEHSTTCESRFSLQPGAGRALLPDSAGPKASRFRPRWPLLSKISLTATTALSDDPRTTRRTPWCRRFTMRANRSTFLATLVVVIGLAATRAEAATQILRTGTLNTVNIGGGGLELTCSVVNVGTQPLTVTVTLLDSAQNRSFPTNCPQLPPNASCNSMASSALFGAPFCTASISGGSKKNARLVFELDDDQNVPHVVLQGY